MNVTVKVVSDSTKTVTNAILALAATRVMVGVPSVDTTRKPVPGEPDNITNASIAYIHEHGAPEVNIPARPFMQPGVEAIKGDIEVGLKKAGLAALDGNADKMNKQLGVVGLQAQAAIRAKITEGPFAPLAISTIKARARRGRKGAKQYLKLRGEGVPEDVLNDASLVKPLIDTAQLRNAINYVIRVIKGK